MLTKLVEMSARSVVQAFTTGTVRKIVGKTRNADGTYTLQFAVVAIVTTPRHAPRS